MENDQVCARYDKPCRSEQLTSTVQGVLVDLYVPRKCAATSECFASDVGSESIQSAPQTA